jgi:hypothetical protein
MGAQIRSDGGLRTAGPTLIHGQGAHVPTETHFVEHDTKLADWCWIATGTEAHLLNAIHRTLKAGK